MKKIRRILVGVIILGLLGFGIYKFFIDVEKYNTTYDKYFTLEEMDYAVVDDEVIVKLINIKDDRCLDVSCDREGQFKVKLLLINQHKFTLVDLGTLEPTLVELDKISLEYTLELIRINDDGKSATLRINKNS